MAKKKEEIKDEISDSKLPLTIKSGVEAIAKGLGVAAVELWSIFVRQYFVKGVTELFTAISLSAFAWALHGKIGWWALLPTAVAHFFLYGAILLLGNPKYYAIQDITRKIKELK